MRSEEHEFFKHRGLSQQQQESEVEVLELRVTKHHQDAWGWGDDALCGQSSDDATVRSSYAAQTRSCRCYVMVCDPVFTFG